MKILHEMAIVAEAVYNVFQPKKLNYALLGAGNGMYWGIVHGVRITECSGSRA